jgi:hypothetical protein
VYEVVRDFQTGYSSAGILLNELGQLVLKTKDLSKFLAHDKSGILLERMAVLNLTKSTARAILIDKETEEAEYKDQRLTGVKDILEKFEIRLSMALGWPATILLGQSPKGLNATGESDLTNWYDYIEGERERNLDKQLTKLVRLVFKTLNDEPKTWAISFNPLWQASAKEIADERKVYAETDAINIDRGVYSAEEVAQSRYSGDEFSTEIMLDQELRDTDNIPSADPADVPDLRTEPEESKTERPQDEAMAAGQITALMDVVKAFNNEEITREQAISILVVTFQMAKEDAAALVGLEPIEKKEPPLPKPTPLPFGAEPEPEPQPIPEPTEDSIEKRGSKWVVLSEAGKVLGTHTTEREALEHLRAIEAAKHGGE